MSGYDYPSAREYAKLLGGRYTLARFDITQKTKSNFMARQLFKVISDIQHERPNINIGVIGSPNSGKSHITSEILKYSGKINYTYEGKYNTFRGISSRFGQIARFDMWAPEWEANQELIIDFLHHRPQGKSVLMLEHAQLNKNITYDIILTVTHRAQSRELDVTLQPAIAQTPTYKTFEKRTAKIGISLGL